jgi:FkbM family methyltransferase
MYYSQCYQDKLLEENVFKGFKNGLFIDVGAHDGVSFNNTLYFQKNHNWRGINIEPIKSVYDKLVINRPKDMNLNCAVSQKNGTEEFVLNEGHTEMISGLKTTYDTRHYDRLQKELQEHGGKSLITIVETKRLDTICDEYNIKYVNYLSIDVEGAEFEVIKSISFDKVFIDVIGFENNYTDSTAPIIAYLKEKNYKVLYNYSDIIMIHNNSMFNRNLTT